MIADVPHLIDIPLSTGTSVVGRMRLHMPTGAAEPDLLTSATLQNIGHQLASSIQIGQLVADLNRRKKEGHGLYDILLRISNQDPLGDTLAALVGHARDPGRRRRRGDLPEPTPPPARSSSTAPWPG